MAGLLDMLQGLLTPDLVQKASSYFSEDSGNTQKALGTALPALLGGVANRFGTGSGPQQLFGMATDAFSENPTLASDAATAFSGSATTSDLVDQGQNLVKAIFGSNAGAVSNAVASTSGVSPTSAGSMLALGAPILMSLLGKITSQQGLTAGGLVALIMGERDNIAALLPAGLGALVSGAAPAVSGLAPGATPDRRTPGWLWPLVGLLALLAIVFAYRSFGQQQTNATGLSSVSLCGGKSIDLSTGSFNYNLAKYLSDTTATNVPQNFVFDHLNFDTGSAVITPESAQTVTDLTTILSSCSTADVRLEGYTDNTGDAAANKTLSQQRADAVKATLIKNGIDAARIEAVGYGSSKPLGSNDTDEGRAKNRRTELTVVKK
jgi:OmpA-OmpF porin, OOP family